jgi:amidophosphoribosyltransferase
MGLIFWLPKRAPDPIHAEFIREIEPGEVLIIDENGLRSERPFRTNGPRSACLNMFISRVRTA